MSSKGHFLGMISHQLRGLAQQGKAKELDSLIDSYPWLLNEEAELSKAIGDAITRDHENVVDMLMDKRDVPVMVACEEGTTPIHYAARYNKTDMIKKLAERGANLNVQDENGNTPMHLAVDVGHCNAPELLIDLGADAGIRNKRGHSPLDIVRARRYIGLERGMITRIAKRHEITLKRGFTRARRKPGPHM